MQMPLKQLNRFCGIVSKKMDSPLPDGHSLLLYKRKISQNLVFFSNLELNQEGLFDGYIIGEEDGVFNIDQIEHYSGSWAAASFKEELLVLSRDRLGVRAIYYFENETYFCFANEIKSLLAIEFIKFKVSQSAAFRFLFLSENEVLGDSLFEGIKEIPPSCNLIFDLKQNTFQVLKYYDFILNKTNQKYNEELVGETLKSNLESVLNSIIHKDKKIAALLSGGIDSSAIASSIFGIGKHNSISFLTAMADDPIHDELPYAEFVVKKLGILEWHQVLAQNLGKEIEEMHLAMELPTLSAGSFLQFELMRFAKHQGIDYVIDGTGADSLYAGHYYYKAIYWNSLFRRGKFRKLIHEIRSYDGQDGWLKYFIRNIVIYYYLPKFPVNIKYKIAIKNNPLLTALDPIFVQFNKYLLNENKSSNIKDLNIFLKSQFFDGGVKKLLRFLDRFGKYFDVMNLSIFSEHRELFENALPINPDLKIKNGQLKYILRFAFKDIMPIEILERNDKKGLVAPNNRWIKENKEVFLTYFDQDLSDYFQMDSIKSTISKSIDELDEVENYKLFKFISFAIWYKVFTEKYSH